MNLKEMPKQQRDMLLLGVMGGFTVVVLALNLFLFPAQEEAKKARETIEKLSGEVRKGEAILKRDRIILEETRTNAEKLLAIHDKELPPEDNQNLWTRLRITSLAREMGLNEMDPLPHRAARFVEPKKPFKEVRATTSLWQTYAVRVASPASFATAMDFIDRLTAAYPFVSLAMLSITPREETPELHQVEMVFEWPVPRDPSVIALIRKELEAQR